MRNIVTIVFFIAAILLFVIKNAFHSSVLAVNVMNDIIAIPVFLIVMNFLMCFVYGREFRMNFFYIIGTVLTIGFLFEVLFPMISDSATSDPLDMIWYSVGGILYWLIYCTKKVKAKPVKDQLISM